MASYSRAPVLAVLVILASPGPVAAVSGPIQLEWVQLIPAPAPGESMARTEVPTGVVQHGELTFSDGTDDRMSQVVTAYDGKRVRLPGYIVPLDFIGSEVKEFLLVPYVGACIHVPPPPPNQIVFVTSADGVEVSGLFQPVWVTGTMSARAVSTELADIGYQIAADLVEPYEE